MNILIVNHYAGSPRHGMEYRPYYLAREWVRAGHGVQIVAASFSHVRSRQPDLPASAGSAFDETIDGIGYRWLRTPSYRGNGVGRALTKPTLSIVNNGMPSFNREISAGGNTYTAAIQQRLAVSVDGAEAYKVGGAIAAAGGGADVVPQEVHRILAQVSEQVAEQFQRSLDFYINDAVDTQLTRIYLSGGSSLVPQLPKAIQDRSRIPVEILDPFVRVEVDARRFDVNYLRANAPVAAIAFGLALRRPGDST